jgi:hypothetical protein
MPTLQCYNLSQRKFRDIDEEESYFNDDDTEEIIPSAGMTPVMDVASLQG